MESLKTILEGWKNNVLRNNPELEELAKKRILICNSCPKRSSAPNDINGLSTCTQCGCVIEAKVRVKATECPDKKW